MANNADNRGFENDLLAWSAARATRWPHLFSSVIERYLELNNLSEDALSARLNCDLNTLNHLRLSGRPDSEPSAFALDIQRVADKLSLDAGMLASIVREVDAAEAFGRAAQNPSQSLPSSRAKGSEPALREAKGQVISPFSATSGMLKAARDRDVGAGGTGDGSQESDAEAETDGDNEPEALEDERPAQRDDKGNQSI